jgi:hypothetical protein
MLFPFIQIDAIRSAGSGRVNGVQSLDAFSFTPNCARAEALVPSIRCFCHVGSMGSCFKLRVEFNRHRRKKLALINASSEVLAHCARTLFGGLIFTAATGALTDGVYDLS